MRLLIAAGNPLLELEPGLMIWTVIVFLLTLVVLKKIAWGPLLESLDERENKIHDALSQAQKAQQEAESAINQAREDAAQAVRRSEEMIQQTRTEAGQLRQKMIEEAKAESQKVVDQGMQRIEAEQRAAMQEIRKASADLAIQAAGRLIQSSMTADQQRQIVDDFLRELPDSTVQ